MTQDIGVNGLWGGAGITNGVFTVTGSGDDIWNSADTFRFVYVTNSSNCTMIARVVSVQNSDGWAKAGIMARDSMDPGAANVLIAVTPGNGVTWQYRSSDGGGCNNNTASGGAPYWVKLVRSGTTFTGYYSPNGTTWTQVASTTLTNISYIGLAVTSHNSSSLCAATFDNVSVPGWTNWTVPATPGGLIAAATDGQVALNWVASSNAASYNVKRATTNGGTYTIVANVGMTNYTDIGLTNGSVYYYVVSALNPAGESPNSEPVSATPQALVPKGLTAAAVSVSEINLDWNNLTNATSYNVKRSLTAGGSYLTIASGLTTTNYQDGGLAAGTVYYYVVSAMVSGRERPGQRASHGGDHFPDAGFAGSPLPFQRDWWCQCSRFRGRPGLDRNASQRRHPGRWPVGAGAWIATIRESAGWGCQCLEQPHGHGVGEAEFGG